ncbi:conjugal transfer protein TrbI [Deltaproteobacteria bacterium Smac51]|nr:conjugal transfer protein TrbI [Deltaproteobacteria bacterium Smac51]
MAKAKESASPGFLAPKPAVKKSNKKVLAAIVASITTLAVVLMVTMTSQKDNQAQDMGLAAVASSLEGENKPLVPPVEGFGLAMPETPKTEANKPADGLPEPNKYVGPPKTDPEEEARRREADEIRRRKFEREQQAFGSIMLVQRGSGNAGSGSVDADGDGYIDQPTPADTPADPNAYDPAADQDKEQFFTRSDARDWISPHTREAGRTFELKTGSVIPGVMVSGINSDLPGHLIAQVSQNVYDTATGRDLLLPQGAKLFGVYDSRVVYGQSRVLIAWNRVVFPDGSSVTLGAMPGTDISGYAGFKDKVDNHYMRIFGSAVLMSLVTGGMSYAVDQVSNNDSDSDSTSMQDEMIAALAAQLGQTTLQLLQKNLNIKPTLEIRPGYQFNIIVTKDVIFRTAYAGK